MKNKFCGYYDLTPAEFDELWQSCVFVCDANVLLDLYRYSSETKDTLLNVLSSIEDRLWIPYQVAYEYHNNLFKVIKEQVTKCSDVIGELQGIQNKVLQKCQEKRNHPYVKQKHIGELSKFCKRFCDALEAEKKEVEKLLYHNPTKEALAQLLNNKIGDKLLDDELRKIYAEGEKRFCKKIPPGYKDANSKKGEEKYGDLVIWREIILMSKEKKKDVIFITTDVKEDWYNRYNGKTLGPRAELILEFKKETGRRFYAYPTSSFLEQVKTNLNRKDISQEAIEEVLHITGEMADSMSEFQISQLESSNNNYNMLDMESTIGDSLDQVGL